MVKDPKEKKKVPGWSIEEMKERPNIVVVEDTEEMQRWRRLDWSEMEPCWKNLAEKMEEDVLDKYKVEEIKKGLQRQRQPIGMEKSAKRQEIQNQKVVKRLLGETSLLV